MRISNVPWILALLVVIVIVIQAASSIEMREASKIPPSIRLERVWPQFNFASPTEFEPFPDDTDRIAILEQHGVVRVLGDNPSSAPIWIDLSSKVHFHGEQGLLGIAFHPSFRSNGVFFLHYSQKNTGDTIIARYSTPDPSREAPLLESEEIIFKAEQPFINHNGGKIAFGPDGYLYIALGDGGGAGDPKRNAQNLSSPLGKLLRINVDVRSAMRKYSTPSDNPFHGAQDGRLDEIFAWGFRNPWKFSFDTVTGELWLADVGQGRFEEVHIVQKGRSYGWDTLEGAHCYRPIKGCDPSGHELPVVEYGHHEGRSITGGYVFRDPARPDLVGHYVFGDFASGRIWGFDRTRGERRELIDTDLMISSFGVDRANQLYVLSYGDGAIYRIR